MATSETSLENENIIQLPSVFDDTLGLLLEAHEYFQEHGMDTVDKQDADYTALYACEMSRITMRLSSIMAWLMIQKAIFLGKLMQEDVSQNYQLGTRELCTSENASARERLPMYMNYLLDESLLLYQRVSRLETMALHASQSR